MARAVLACLAVLWAVALPLAAYAANRSGPDASPFSLFALAVYEVGSIICHQRPERSFHLASAPLPVCARCSGIYAGAAVAALASTVLIRNRPSRDLTDDHGIRLTASAKATAVRRFDSAKATSNAWRTAPRAVLVASAIPAMLTLIYEWASGYVPSNELRALTGVLLGAAVGWVLVRLE